MSHTGGALVPFVAASPAAPRPAARALPLRAVLLAAVAGLAAGSGAIGAYQVRHHLSGLAFGRTEPAAAAMHRLEEQVSRLQGSLEALRVAGAAQDENGRRLAQSVDAVRQEVGQGRANAAATSAQLSARMDRPDRDPGPRLAELTSRIDRLEQSGVAAIPNPRVTVIPQPAPKPPVPAAPLPAQAELTKVPAALAKAPPVEGPPAVTGWVLRDVYDGVALVQRRNGGLREVEPGEFLPGAGEIRSIERRGRAWVVLTSRGVIATN